MTRTRNLTLAAVLLMLGAAALSAGDASAFGFDAFRHRLHGCHGLHHCADPARLAGPGRPSCLAKQVKPDGTVVFIDRCAQESAVVNQPAIARMTRLREEVQ